MKTINTLIITTLLAISNHSYAVEIIPLFGLRGGGEFIDKTTDKKHTLNSSSAYGVILSFAIERGKNFEVYYSHQSTQLNSITITGPSPVASADIPLTVDYLHFGGTAPIYHEKHLKTFVSGGLGFTYLSPDFPDSQSDLRASLSIGLGMKWPITERIALRLETRGFATLYNNNSAILCNGGCTIAVSGNYVLQAEVTAGIGFKF